MDVSAGMGAPVEYQHAPPLVGEIASDHRTGQTGSDDQVVDLPHRWPGSRGTKATTRSSVKDIEIDRSDTTRAPTLDAIAANAEGVRTAARESGRRVTRRITWWTDGHLDSPP